MPPGTAVPWAPEDLPVPADELMSWSYIVLEEVVDDVALLRRWPWPVVDPLGRLLWPDNAEQDSAATTVDRDVLKAQVYTPNGLEREPRCGDTFATPQVVQQRRRGTHTRDLRALLGDEQFYDISADAREAAKIIYQASLGAIQPASAVEDDSVTEVEQALQRRAEQQLRPLRLGPPPGSTHAARPR
jgi:hypothetical protein